MADESIIVEQFKEEYDVIDVLELAPDADIDETIQVIEVEDVELFTIESSEAFSALGEPNEQLKHQLLTGRDANDQHPIDAITGLRTKLDEIEALKTVYSDKIGIANYYAWNDGTYDEHGYFVSLVPGTSTIRICRDTDIFGVSVEAAGFIGGQSAPSPRAGSYGLIATSGLVDVRCESDVAEGDYVVSNAYGVATKTDSGCGYKVIAIENKDGVVYAVIALGVQACTTDLMGKNLQYIGERMDNAETNIAAAMNVANEAYNKVTEINVSNREISDKVNGAIDEMNGTIQDVEKMGALVESATIVSTQAKAIAESAITSAETSRQESIEAANNSLAEIANLRKEVEVQIDEINTDLDNSLSELQETKESIDATRDELQGSIDGAVKDLEELEKDLEPLITWPDAENPTGVAGFVTRADEESVTLGGLVKWQGETNKSIADFKQEVSENYSTQEMVTAVGDNLTLFKQEVADTYATQEMVSEVDNALTGYKQEVEKNYATQQMLSSVEDNLADYKQEVTDTYATQQMVTAVDDNLASYKQEVGKTYATQEMVTTLETNTSKALSDYKQEVEDGYATQEMVTQLETDTSKALTDYKQEISDTYATQTSLTNLRTDTTNAITASEEKATKTYASKSDLTSFESDTNTALTRIEQKADANGAYIQSTVANMDKYSVGPYSQAQGFTLEQAKNALELGMIYVPTVSHTDETYNEDYDFTRMYTYTWTEEGWEESIGKVVFFGTAPSGIAYSLWYKEGGDNSDGYEPNTLYKLEEYTNEAGETLIQWVAVATLQGNSSNRSVSQVRQDTNSIIAEVVDARGNAASLGARVTDTESEVQSLVSWTKDADGNQYNLATIKQTANDAGASIAQVVETVGENGEVTAASIVAAVNGSDTSVVINADHIQFEGFVSFASKDDVKEVQDSAIYDTKVEYALSNSSSEFVAITEWSTVAPAWQENTYMWQKTTITKGDASVDFTQTCIQGAKGEQGIQGEKGNTGDKGDAGRGIVSKTEYYIRSSSSTNPTANTSTWSTTVPTLTTYYRYLWNYETVTYTDETTEDTAKRVIGVYGDTGGTGATGTSITGVVMQYHISTSNTTAPSTSSVNWVTDPTTLSWSATNYIWCREKISYSNNTTSYTTARVDDALSVVSSWCYDSNKTTINGGKIATGTITAEQILANTITTAELSTDAIKSTNYNSGVTGSLIPSANYSTAGTFLNLSDGAIYSKNFCLDANGNAYFKGNINATSGTIGSFSISNGWINYLPADVATTGKFVAIGPDYIALGGDVVDPKFYVTNNGYLKASYGNVGGFDIGETSISHTKTSYSETTNDGVWLGIDGIGLGKGKFTVSNAGYLTATSGKIGGFDIDATTLTNGQLILKENTIHFNLSETINAYLRYNTTSKVMNFETEGSELWLTSDTKIRVNGDKIALYPTTSGQAIEIQPSTKLKLSNSMEILTTGVVNISKKTEIADDLWVRKGVFATEFGICTSTNGGTTYTAGQSLSKTRFQTTTGSVIYLTFQNGLLVGVSDA